MSSEPPSRIPPRTQSHETKSARDELSSKGKVEKVREVDADETRKRKFDKYYKGAQAEDAEGKPTPFDLAARGPNPNIQFGQARGAQNGLGDVDNAVIPSPADAPPPNVASSNSSDENTNGLPQSNDFWEDVDFPPDQQPPNRNLQETHNLAKKPGKKDEKDEKKGGAFALPDPKTMKIEKPAEKKVEPSPFGPPGKVGKPHEEKQSFGPFAEKKEAPRPFAAAPQAPSVKSDKPQPSAHHKKGPFFEESLIASPKQGEKGEDSGKKNKDQKATEIEKGSLPSLPGHVEPAAQAAMTQATPYLNPTTAALFYHMVGTIYLMAGPQGVSRTEIVLNNPSYAGSRFFGATIRIEKYATAPDSFNITLTGTNEAVKSFQQNIPSLMNAFQNGNFAFRIGRLDTEYSTERPVFRRKEKGESRGQAGDSDLGEGKR